MIDQALMDAYIAYAEDLVSRGIIDHSLEMRTLDGTSAEQAIRDILREAGRLPAEPA